VRDWLSPLLVFIASFLFVLKACSTLDSLSQGPSGQLAPSSNNGTPLPAAPSTAHPAAPAVITPYMPVLPGSIHTYLTLDAFLSDAQTNINDYWLHQPFPRDRPYTAPRATLMQPGQPVPCATGLTQWTTFYCPNERTIYLYQPVLLAGNMAAGYAGMYAILAHEWTHHVQFILRVPQSGSQFELQADCGSGMFLAAGWPGMAPSALESLRRMLNSSTTDTLHGTPAQRLAAFDGGYLHGTVDHCSLPMN
jgi:predicted metalloprotease